MFKELARSAIIISGVVESVERISAGRKMKRRHLDIPTKFKVVRGIGGWTFRNYLKMMIGTAAAK